MVEASDNEFRFDHMLLFQKNCVDLTLSLQSSFDLHFDLTVPYLILAQEFFRDVKEGIHLIILAPLVLNLDLSLCLNDFVQ